MQWFSFRAVCPAGGVSQCHLRVVLLMVVVVSMTTPSAFSGEDGPPRIEKLGTIACDVVESTPIVFRGKRYRFEWVRAGNPENRLKKNHFHFVDVATSKTTKPFAVGYAFGSAFERTFDSLSWSFSFDHVCRFLTPPHPEARHQQQHCKRTKLHRFPLLTVTATLAREEVWRTFGATMPLSGLQVKPLFLLNTRDASRAFG